MSNLCEFCGKEAMGGVYQMRGELLNICSECSTPNKERDYIKRLDLAAKTAWDAEIALIKKENEQLITNNKTALLTAQKQEYTDKIAVIDGELNTLAEVVK